MMYILLKQYGTRIVTDAEVKDFMASRTVDDKIQIDDEKEIGRFETYEQGMTALIEYRSCVDFCKTNAKGFYQADFVIVVLVDEEYNELCKAGYSSL